MLKSTKSCPRCRGTDVGLLDHLPEQADEATYQAVGVMAYHHVAGTPNPDPQKRARATSQPLRRLEETDGVTKAGTVEAYVCGHCGYLEHYVQDVHWLLDEIEQMRRFRWVEDGETQTEGAMRMTVCRCCGGTRVGELGTLPDTRRSERDVSVRYVGRDSDKHKHGVLSGRVCAECGYLETYVAAPDKVPWNELDGFSWVSGGTDLGPYR